MVRTGVCKGGSGVTKRRSKAELAWVVLTTGAGGLAFGADKAYAATHSTTKSEAIATVRIGFMTLPISQSVVSVHMAKKSTRATKKSKAKTGRPVTTGAGKPLVVRMHTDEIKRLDDWIDESKISRPEAIRQLVKWALGAQRSS